MPDPIAKKRLKKRMLDRWENEGGKIAADTTSADTDRPASKDKGRGSKLSLSDNSTTGAPASTAKRRKPNRK